MSAGCRTGKRQLLVRHDDRLCRWRVAMTALWQNRASLIYAALGILITASLIFATVNFLQRRQTPPPPIDMPARAQACRSEIQSHLDLTKIAPEVWDQVANICYGQVRGEALLADFNIRRSNLVEQQVEGRIVLWMVVAITLSGVALAGLQLLAAYRLADSGHGDLATAQEITLEQNKISLKSSVTGLLILVVSFAFFMVYVAWVYTSKELQQGSPEMAKVIVTTATNSGTSPVPALSGYGPPPSTPPVNIPTPVQP
jgi:hypothetical protein